MLSKLIKFIKGRKAPQKKTGNIRVHLINTENSNVFSQDIYGITIFTDPEEMSQYLGSTIMTTMARNIKLVSYVELNE